jgi:hypothetical protein
LEREGGLVIGFREREREGGVFFYWEEKKGN